jgi:mono/diheme cytochrome c family protein
MHLKIVSILSLVFFAGIQQIGAQNWDIPKPDREKTAPFLFTDSIRSAGAALYVANCKSCHGDPGKNNHANLVPIPRDPVSSEYQNHTDGEMFYIISVGRGLMPTFQASIPEDQRWFLVAYVRSYNKDYVQPPVKASGTGEIASTIKMSLTYNQKDNAIIAKLIDTANDKEMPVRDVVVKLFVKRTFGNLMIGQSNTGPDGKTRIKFPQDIPGDKEGNLELIAVAGTGGKQITVKQQEKIGLAINPPQLLDQRAWWNVRSMAPLWLVIAYVCGGIAVGSSVLFVFMQLKKIRDLNQLKNN